MSSTILRALLAYLLLGVTRAQLSQPGDSHVVPGWHLQSTANLEANITELSQSGANVSSWYRVPYRGTVFAGLVGNDVYNDTQLFFSDNLEATVDYSEFEVPWLYREELEMSPAQGQHYRLVTNGITSRADIFFNGRLIADNDTQVGAYGGRSYDITSHVMSGNNIILIRAYPTDYLRDFAMGFVDWNP
jgi:exo-1,4-beta-D-glucosaminidase